MRRVRRQARSELIKHLQALRLGFSDESNFAGDTTTFQAYELLSDAFGPGFNGPIFVVTELASPADAPALQELAAALASDPGVASVSPAIPNDGQLLATGSMDGTAIIWNVASRAPIRKLDVRPYCASESPVWSLAFSPDRKTLALLGIGNF